jgi:aminoglycoside phosphotransferase (APT) family kinase protein
LIESSIGDEPLRNRIAERARLYFPDLRAGSQVRISKNTRRAYSDIYELEIAESEHECRRVIVKKTRSARREYDELRFLWKTFSLHSDYGIPRPLDYFEDGPAVVMEAVSGSSLQAIFPRWYWRSASVNSAESACRKAGEWLCLYHQIEPPTPPASPDLNRKIADFQSTWRNLAAVGFSQRRYEKIERWLTAMMKRLIATTFVTVRVHGDFSIDNVWLDGGRVVVLDISGARSNPPELDVAAFLNSLLLIRFGGWIPLDVFRALRRAFFQGYGVQPRIDSVAVSFFQAMGMVDALWELWERRPGRFTRALSRPVLAGLAEILDERTF